MANTPVTVSATGSYFVTIDSDDDSTSQIFAVTTPTGSGSDETLLFVREDGIFIVGNQTPGTSFVEIDRPNNDIELSEDNWTIKHKTQTTNADIIISSNDDIELKYDQYSSAGIPELRVIQGASTIMKFDENGDAQFLNDAHFDNDVLISSGAVVGSNPSSVPTDVILEVRGNGGFLLPRLSSTERDALSAQGGFLIYNKTEQRLEYFNGSWRKIDDSAV
tara:strand:+ start:1196 stop:1855 length:660 start_codon:yes stop_codon:yes gene_type:complete